MTSLSEIYSALIAGSQSIGNIAKVAGQGSSISVPVGTSGPPTQASYRILAVSSGVLYAPWNGS